jgi:hypothetical protein
MVERDSERKDGLLKIEKKERETNRKGDEASE